jgi:hypothetical protein
MFKRIASLTLPGSPSFQSNNLSASNDNLCFVRLNEGNPNPDRNLDPNPDPNQVVMMMMMIGLAMLLGLSQGQC